MPSDAVTGDNQGPEVTRLAEVVEELGLRELGYRIEYPPPTSDYVGVVLGHPLLLGNTWGVSGDSTRPGWIEWIRDQVTSWPDVALVREAVVRAESVSIVAALRNGAIHARLGRSEETAEGAVRAATLAGLALVDASILTPEEADWLSRALESDEQWFR